MDRRMYVPPHRRSTLSITSSLDGQPPSTRESLFEGTILNLKRLHIQAPSEMASTKGTRSGTLKESQSVRRGHGRFGAPPSSISLPTNSQAPSVMTPITGPVSELNFEDSDEDLNTASAQYCISTNIDRLSIATPSVISSLATRPRTPSPSPTPPTPAPLPRFYGPDLRKPSPRPLIERLGPKYIPPGSIGRSILAKWPTIPMGGGRWNSKADNNLIKRQRENIRIQASDLPGPSRKGTLQPTFTQLAVLFHTLGEEIGDLRPDEVAIREGEEIRGVEYAGSYKWIESEDGMPTLAVPAVPDIWDPPKVVGKLAHDGTIEAYEEFPDYASALLPPNLSTLEPLFLSLTSPDILQDIDLVTGRNNLRKLWSAMKETDNHHTSPFRIDIEYIGPQLSEEHEGTVMRPGMVILERYEPPNKARSRQPPNGYHQSYHEATTRKVLDGSDRTPGCNRVIKYTFGGMTMMVKFDTSAFIPDKPNWTEYESGVTDLFDNATDNGQASTVMDGLDFDDPVYNGQAIKIRHTNLAPPPLSSCISIKTKHHLDAFDAEYHFPQMYFSQTPKVIYARHQAGNFKFPIEHYDLFNDRVTTAVEAERQMMIDRVGGILRWIVGLARTHKRGLGLVWDGKRFSVCEREEGPQLSAPVKEMIRDVRMKGREESMVGDGQSCS